VKAFGASTLDRIGGEPGDLVLAVSGPDRVTSPALHAVRTGIVSRPEARPGTDHAFCWVVDFPMFEQDPESGEWIFTHHPFTSPHPDDVDHLESDPGRCRALHYDAVFNGNELGSGSIRITDPELQSRVFRFLGIDALEQQRRFGFLLDSLASGAPPHGGFALGFDRISMLLSGAASLRDVIAFPKTTQARALFEGAPVPVPATELAALHITPITEDQ
jgi:aspartyl-tRNA synthetase